MYRLTRYIKKYNNYNFIKFYCNNSHNLVLNNNQHYILNNRYFSSTSLNENSLIIDSSSNNIQFNIKKQIHKEHYSTLNINIVEDDTIKVVSDKIINSLNENEIKYFELFKNVIKHNNLLDKVELRISGGWVRNKLLKIDESNNNFDIDIAINGISGREFVDLIEKYRIDHGLSQKKYLVKRNPEKSKHLETASIVIDGYTFDFTGLRDEQYDNQSRIPQIKDGTPTSDAFRRDITINTLYFNLDTYKVEDYTGNGINDLKNQLIRTPLSPHITLIEDPLRALRVLRFATRFHFNIDPPLYRAIESIEVRSSLGYKVSKERIKTEFSLMMSHYHTGAIQYFKYLVDTNLVDVVFQSTGSIQIPKEDWLQSLNYLNNSLKFKNQIPKELEQDFILGAIFLPLKLKYKDLDLESLLDHFKSPKKQVKTIQSLVSAPDILINQIIKPVLISSHISKESLTQPHIFDHVTLPLLNWLRLNENWQLNIWVSALHSLIIDHQVLKKESFWIEFKEVLQEFERIANQKHYLDGHEVKNTLGITANGQPITNIVNQLLIWQWKQQCNNKPLDKNKAQEYVKSLWQK